MNKKFLFAAMSLVALSACTNDEFDSQKAAEDVSPIQFEVINDNDAVTRASMNGNTIVWNANDGDLFTLYHGAAAAGDVTGYQNATYKAEANPGGTATLSSPSMILDGYAIMVWPVDTTFRITSGGDLSIKIPADQTNIEDNIPYVSDQLQITARPVPPAVAPAAYNEAGYNRKYPVYMRPMASQLNIKADYAGTDATLATLYTGDDAIDEISVTSIELSTNAGGADLFTTEVPVKFSAAANANWTAANQNAWHTNWARATEFDVANIAAAGQTATLTTTCLDGNNGCKFLILPQKVDPAASIDEGAVTVNTTYGKVVIGNGSAYTPAEQNGEWYRYLSAATAAEAYEAKAATAGSDGKYKTTASVGDGLRQTLKVFRNFVAPASLTKIAGEPMGTAATRYVKVLLNHLDMSGLHVTSDKQLRDAARVWQKMNLPNVTVYLDGDATGKFEISQTTIAKIKDINAGANKFTVKPCDTHLCNKIVITGGGNVPDLDFIKASDGANKADVVLKAEQNWSWTTNTVDSKKAIKVDAAATGVASIINKGTFASNGTATIAIYDNDAPAVQVTTIPFVNDGTWTISGGDLNVQFDVINTHIVTIESNAEYHQDGAGNDFTNDAETLPGHFLDDPSTEKIGKVNNSGVFAGVNGGHINNYGGLIEHLADNAKTYIYANTDGGAGFGTAFGAANRIGRINLPYSNKDEENVSISNGAATGFVSVTVSTKAGAPANGKLDLSSVGDYVNYCIIEGGVTQIDVVSAKIKYVQFDAGTNEIMWNVDAANYDGLIVFSPVNVKRNTTVNVANSVYLKAKMYVGGATDITSGKCNGYFGNTSGNFAKMYLTY